LANISTTKARRCVNKILTIISNTTVIRLILLHFYLFPFTLNIFSIVPNISTHKGMAYNIFDFGNLMHTTQLPFF